MKKILIIGCIIGIISISMILNKSYYTYKEVKIGDNKVNIALTLDGSSISDVPSKGNYSVNVSCENATGKWDYSDWKLLVNNIKNANIVCSLDFTTVNPADNYLNNKVTSLVGNGEVFNEKFGDYTNATTLVQSDYKNISMYSSTSNSSTSGTVNTNSYSYSGTRWSSVPSNLTSNTYYHIMFNVPSDGYYQICYTMSGGNSGNALYLYNGTTNLNLGGLPSGVSNSSTTEKSGCQDIGFITTSDNLRIIQKTYTTAATISFYLQKASNGETVNVGIRYEGMNPNNYVWFNNELWRIIGVFDDTTHGVTGESLVKIIREKSLGGLSWDTLKKNNWATSSLMKLLNVTYLNQKDGTNGSYCYGFSPTSKAHCDYRENGISDDYRKMIETRVVWKLGGISSQSNTASSFYAAERGTTVYSGNATVWPNNSGASYPIGLMYVSDYGYAVPAANCPRATYLLVYNNANCTLNNWLYSQGKEWTIMHNSKDAKNVFNLSDNGSVGYTYFDANVGYAVRPVLYLKSNVWVISGDGSEANPYILAI